MGKRAERLAELLRAEGLVVDVRLKDPRPKQGSLPEAWWEQVMDRYHALDGVQRAPRLAPGPWDMRAEEGFIELDEERHFNRWRATTLDAPAYARVRWLAVEDYRGYCVAREPECSRAASDRGSWTTGGAETQFGPPGPEGILERRGSPRWRQRALYDFMKDLGPLAGFPRLARISIWETLPGHEPVLVNDALGPRFTGDPGPALVRMIEARWA